MQKKCERTHTVTFPKLLLHRHRTSSGMRAFEARARDAKNTSSRTTSRLAEEKKLKLLSKYTLERNMCD